MTIHVTPIPRLIDLAAPSFTLGTANAAGSAVTTVSSDSTLLAFDTTLPAAVGTAAVGSATVAPRRDHVHAGTTLAAPALTLGTANSAGSASTVLATDATLLAFDTTLPDAITFGQSGAVGSSTTAARRSHAHAMAAEPAVTTLVITGSVTVGANGKTGVTIAAAEAGPVLYIYDVWVAVDDVAVSIGPDINADETISAGISSFILRYAQASSSAASGLNIVNGTATSRTIEYRLYELPT